MSGSSIACTDAGTNSTAVLLPRIPSKRFIRKLKFLAYTCAKDKVDAAEMYSALHNLFNFHDSAHTATKMIHASQVKKNGTQMSFALWAFVRSDKMRNCIVQVLNSVLCPRVRLSAETREGQLDAMYVVNVCKIGLCAEDLETWVLQFMDIVRSSPGIIVFSAYMGVQMVSSIDRIENGRANTISHNLQQNPDFLQLYKDRLARRDDLAQVHMQTSGMQFSPTEFVWLYREHGALARSLQIANEENRGHSHEIFRLQGQLMQTGTNNDEIRTIINALRTTFCINADTHALILHLLRRQPHSASRNGDSATSRLYTAFARSVNGTYEQSDFTTST